MERDNNGRFVEGNEGGPGRPKGSLSLLAIIKDVLMEKAPDDEKTYAEKLIRSYIKTALVKNDGQSIRDLVDRIDGKALQTVSVHNEKDAEWLELAERLTNGVEHEAGKDNSVHAPEPAENNDT